MPNYFYTPELFLVVVSIQISPPSILSSHPYQSCFIPCFIKLILEGLRQKGKYSKHLGQTNNYPADNCCDSYPVCGWEPRVIIVTRSVRSVDCIRVGAGGDGGY